MRSIGLTSLLLVLAAPGFAAGDDGPPFTRQEDVIYGRKDGTALTMDVFRPKGKANGAAIVLVISGGFYSSHEGINPAFALPMVNRGYTVFAVVHGSQPRYTVPEIVGDLRRAVRFIRNHAKDYGIAPNRIGATGASAGGHLSLMLGMSGDKGNPSAKDPVDRESSKVEAVACFFPLTDLLNFGETGRALTRATDHGKPYRGAFDHREVDPETNLRVSVTDPARLRQIATEISPITHVSADDAPTLIIHGDADALISIQQSERMIAALKAAGVDARLVVKPGAGHGWATMPLDFKTITDWFDAHLNPPVK